MNEVESVRIHDSRLVLDDGEVFVRQWIPSRANALPPLVLFHDSLGCVTLWRDFPAALCTTLGRRVVAYDRLGFGQSSPRSSRPELDFIEHEAAVIFPALCAQLELTEVVTFGHSVGGCMALAAASRHPQRCRAVISEAAQSYVEERTRDGIRAAQKAFADEAQLAKLARYHGDKALWVLKAWTDTWLDPGFANWSLQPELATLTCPALVIHGDRDEYGSVDFPRRIGQSVAGPAQVEILEQTGHIPHREQPEQVLKLVARFLNTLENPAA